MFAAAGDEHWDNQFNWNGPGITTYAIATHHGKIYASGLGSSTNVSLQVWDGAQWSAQSQFYGSSPVQVTDLAFVGDTLYAAGTFTNVDGVTASGMAKWDGTNWSSIGFKGAAYSLAVDGSNLYVGGIFTTNLAGLAMKNVARWDGSNWSALGEGLGGTNVSLVYAVAASNGVVYAGGAFANSGATFVTNIARWNGANWVAMDNGLNSVVFSLALDGANVYAGTSLTSGVSRWNGANWSSLGGGFNNTVHSVAVFNGLVCATGSFSTAGGVTAAGFATWNGSSWAAAGTGLSTAGNRVISNGTNIYVGGSFVLAGGIIVNGLATWDGGNWRSIGPANRGNGVSSTVRAIAGTPTNLFVGGSFTAAGRTNANCIARFDGANWHPLGSGIGGSGAVVNTIAVTNNDVYVGGYFSTAGGITALSVARWDGTNWFSVGNPGGMVYALAVRPDGLYAAGTGYSGSSYGSAFVKRWNGSAWSSFLTFNPEEIFVQFLLSDSVGMNSLAFIGSDLYIGGKFNLNGHDPELTMFTNGNNIVRFDGTYGHLVGTGLNSNTTAMAVMGNDLYVAGLFSQAGEVNTRGIARWDGNTWSSVGGGVIGNGIVYTLSVFGPDLYAGGTFTNIGGVAATRIARWNGFSWAPLGSGTSGGVLALNASGNDVFAGGSFSMTGRKPARGIGHWNESYDFDVIPGIWLSKLRYTPGDFKFSINTTGVLNYVIESTTNFSAWTPMATNSGSYSEFFDFDAHDHPFRAYRVRSQP